MIRFMLRVIVILLVVAVAAVVGIGVYGGTLVRNGVNRFGPEVLGVPVILQDAGVSLAQGTARLSGLHVGNPEGFKTDSLLEVGGIEVEIDLRSLASDMVVIRRIHIDAPQFTYEQGLRQSNLGALLEGLRVADGREGGAAPGAGAETPEGKRVVIDELLVEGGKVNLSVTGAMGLSAPVALATVRMRDIGRGGAGGLTVDAAVRLVLETVLQSAMNAVGGVGGLTVDGAKAMGEGAAQAGQAAIEGLKSAAPEAVEGLKVVGDGARQVGGAAVEGLRSAGEGVSKKLGGLFERGKTNEAPKDGP